MDIKKMEALGDEISQLFRARGATTKEAIHVCGMVMQHALAQMDHVERVKDFGIFVIAMGSALLEATREELAADGPT